MSSTVWIVHDPQADTDLTLEELCRVCAVSAEWVEARVQAGLLTPRPDAASSATAWRFDITMRLRVGVMHRLERDFDAVPELAALVADLQDEIRRLRLRLDPPG